jgi:UDP-N-acetylmuramoylalanine-D-glutamate ligase
MDASEIFIPGVHNIENYMPPLPRCRLVPREVCRKVAMEFTGVEHRIELVRTLEACGITTLHRLQPQPHIAGLRCLRKR